jgi:hypothetical protein
MKDKYGIGVDWRSRAQDCKIDVATMFGTAMELRFADLIHAGQGDPEVQRSGQ